MTPCGRDSIFVNIVTAGKLKKISVEISLGLCQVGVAMEIQVLLGPNGASPAGGGGRPIASVRHCPQSLSTLQSFSFSS